VEVKAPRQSERESFMSCDLSRRDYVYVWWTASTLGRGLAKMSGCALW
jgi:hypothetical protein